MSAPAPAVTISVAADGTVTIPAQVCVELGLIPGDELLLHTERDSQVIGLVPLRYAGETN